MPSPTPLVEPVFTARGLTKVYGSGEAAVHALRGVDLTLQRGEMVAVMGPSGCGKTTLLNCLSGIDSIDGGEIVVDGLAIQRLDDKTLTRYRARNMGFVFQAYNLLPVLSAVENVALPLRTHTDLPQPVLDRLVAMKLHAVGLATAEV